jgi:hypothetical protein
MGHVIGDEWTVEVMTPVRMNFCGTGNVLVYKSAGGSLQVLDAADMIKDYPAHVDYSQSQLCWILINPSLPVLSSLPRRIYRREVSSDTTVLSSDLGNEVSYIGTGGHTLTLLPCGSCAGYAVDVVNATNVNWTIVTDPAHATDAIVTGDDPTGVTTIILGPGSRLSCRLESNGVNYHMPFDATSQAAPIKVTVYDTAGNFTWTKSFGYTTAEIEVLGGGGGGAYGGGGSGGGGGAGGRALATIDISALTTVAVAVGAGGAPAAIGTAGTGGTTSFGTHCVAAGGAGGVSAGAGGAGGSGSTGDVLVTGQHGGDSVGGTVYGAGGNSIYGNNGYPTGAGNGHGAGGSGELGASYAGMPGLVIVKEYR